jgi:hypothetical protein
METSVEILKLLNPYLAHSRRQRRSLLLKVLPLNTPSDVAVSPEELMDRIETINTDTEFGGHKLHAASTWREKLPVQGRGIWLRYVFNLWTRRYSFRLTNELENELLLMYQDGLVGMGKRQDRAVYWRRTS